MATPSLSAFAASSLAIALAPTLAAQVQQAHYLELTFTTADGLPSNSVRALEFDDDGQLWVGTLGGLAVFDGNEFIQCTMREGYASIASRINSLALAANGDMLVGTQEGVLARFSGQEYSTLLNGELGSIRAIEEQSDGSLVIAGRALSIWRDGDVRTLASSYSQPTTTALRHGGAVYAAGRWGLWRIMGDETEQLEEEPVDALFEGPDRVLYAVQAGVATGVLQPERVVRLDAEGARVYASALIGPNMAMLACGTTTKVLLPSREDPTVPFVEINGGSVNRPRAIAIRNEGSWIGSDRGGLVYIERTPGFQFVDSSGEPFIYARTVMKLSGDEALIQSSNRELRLFRQSKLEAPGEWIDAEFVDIESALIFGCSQRRGGVAWAASSSGILRIEGQTLRPAACGTGKVSAIVESLNGEVWATEAGSFFQVLPDGRRGRVLPGFEPAPSILAASPNGLYFVASDGIYHLDTTTATGTVEMVAPIAGIREPRSLVVGPHGNLWLTTYGDGLFRVSGGEFEQFTASTGVECDFLGWIEIFADSFGRNLLLMSSNIGLLSVPLDTLIDDPSIGVDGTEGPFSDAAMVLLARESEGPSAARLDCGTVLLPTLAGLAGHSLGSKLEGKSAPRTMIDGVVVNGEDMDRGVDQIDLAIAYGAADIDIGFLSIAMPSAAEASFSYRMVSGNKLKAKLYPTTEAPPWIDSYSARSAQFFNLGPGEYTFQVRSKLPGTNWSEIKSVRVATVLPHFYQQPRVRGLGIVAILLVMGYGYVRFILAEGTSQQLSSEVRESKALAAQALQRETRYAKLLDSAHDGIVLIESNEGISFANDAVTRSFGFSREELLQKDASWLGIADTRSILHAADFRAGEDTTGSVFSRNVQVIDKFGVPHESELVAARTVLDGQSCLLVVVRDLTADHLLLHRLDNSERRFQSLFQGAPTALITFASDLRILAWNRRAEALLDLQDAQVEFLHQALSSPPGRQGFTTQVERTIQSREETTAVHVVKGSNGETFRISWTISPLTTDQGRVTVLMAVLKDLREEERAKARLNDLQRRVAKAQESERSRIAREIHDDLSQRLAATTMNASTIRSMLPDNIKGDVPTMLDGLHGDLDRLTTDIHALSRQLHPTVLDDLGLVRAIQSECARQNSMADARCSLESPREIPDLPSDVALAFFRIAQESIRNATKHGNPESVVVSLRYAEGTLHLSISDDGVGFEERDGRAESGVGLGLVSMQERARLIGAHFSMITAPGEGAEVIVELDLERSDDSLTTT